MYELLCCFKLLPYVYLNVYSPGICQSPSSALPLCTPLVVRIIYPTMLQNRTHTVSRFSSCVFRRRPACSRRGVMSSDARCPSTARAASSTPVVARFTPYESNTFVLEVRVYTVLLSDCSFGQCTQIARSARPCKVSRGMPPQMATHRDTRCLVAVVPLLLQQTVQQGMCNSDLLLTSVSSAPCGLCLCQDAERKRLGHTNSLQASGVVNVHNVDTAM